jgi:hypothetical protein
MKLTKTIKLDFDALTAWEQKCRRINALNESAKTNQKYIEIDGWEAKEVFHWGISDTHIIYNAFQARVLGLDISALPAEGIAEIKNFVVEKKVIQVTQLLELQELPPKPEVKIFNRLAAYKELKKVQPKWDGQAYDLNDHYWENGKKVEPENFYTASYTFFEKVLKVESFWRDLGEDGKILVTRKHYKQEIYRIFPDRLEVWEQEYVDEILPKRSGSVGDVGIGSWSDKGYF